MDKIFDSTYKTAEDYSKLRAALNRALDANIEMAKVNEMIDGIDELSFGHLNRLFEAVAERLLDKGKDGRACVREYVEAIRNNPSVRSMYAVRHAIEHPGAVQSPETYVNEAVSMGRAGKASRDDRFVSAVKEALRVSEIGSIELQSLISEKLDADDALEYVMRNGKTLRNLTEYTNGMAVLGEAVKAKASDATKVKADETPKSEISVEEMIDNINNGLNEGLTTMEAEAIRDVAVSRMSGSDGEEIFESYRRRCEDMLREAEKNENSVEAKSRFGLMIEQIGGRKFDAETAGADILRFAQIMDTISE